MAIEETMSDERRKWEAPYVFRMYPRTCFKAALAEGKIVYESVIVPDESAFRDRQRDGWHDHPLTAIAHYHQIQEDIGQAAAERAYADRQMSAKAQAEAKAAEDAHDGHLADVPVTPIAPKGQGWQKTKG